MNIIHDLKLFLTKLVAESFFFTKITNPKDISDPIVKKLDELKPHAPEKTSLPIVQGLKAVQTAIESKTETDIRPQLDLLATILREEIGKLDREVVVKNDLSQLLGLFKTNGDKKDIVTALKSIEKLIPQVKDVPDYTLLLSEVISAVENVNLHVDLTLIENILLGLKTFELPENLIENERIKVTLSDAQLKKMQGGGYAISNINIRNKENVDINPAIEEKQDPLAKYKDADMDIAGTPKYLCFVALDSSWYIKKIDTSTGVTYTKGNSGHKAAFIGRAGLTYDEFNIIFN